MTTSLSYETFVSQGVQRANGALPSGEPIISSPITSTLISGAEDTLLVDPPFTLAQTARVADWIARSGKRLRYIYVTHGTATTGSGPSSSPSGFRASRCTRRRGRSPL